MRNIVAWRSPYQPTCGQDGWCEFSDEVRALARPNPISVDRLLDAQPAQLNCRIDKHTHRDEFRKWYEEGARAQLRVGQDCRARRVDW